MTIDEANEGKKCSCWFSGIWWYEVGGDVMEGFPEDRKVE